MNFESWWLLALPLFFALGWFASRADAHASRSPAQGQLPEAYFKGLNFLLNEQPDKAIDAFIDVVRLEPETVELHFALGNLFRRRGEYDRAIRVHQNLYDRADIKADQKAHALYELGQDYLRAGLLDRAEDAFNLLATGPYAGAALTHRLAMAQMVSDWPQAIDLAEQLQKVGGEDHSRQLCHFRCEQNDPEGALQAFPEHARPQMMLGDALYKQGDCKGAIAAWQVIAEKHPEYMGLIADRWVKVHQEMDPAGDGGLPVLENVLRERFSSDVFKAAYEARIASQGKAAADQWARPLIQQSSSLGALNRFLKDEGEEQAWLKTLVATHAEPKARYTCKQCGFQAKQYYWRCQGCNQWDSYPPRRL